MGNLHNIFCENYWNLTIFYTLFWGMRTAVRGTKGRERGQKGALGGAWVGAGVGVVGAVVGFWEWVARGTGWCVRRGKDGVRGGAWRCVDIKSGAAITVAPDNFLVVPYFVELSTLADFLFSGIISPALISAVLVKTGPTSS